MTRPTIALLGPYGTGNLGDAAIQDAVIAHLRELVPGAEIVGISGNPADTEWRHGIPAYPIDAAATRVSAVAGDPGVLSPAPRSVLVRWLRSVAQVSRQCGRWLIFLGRQARWANKIDQLVISGGGQIDDYWGGPTRLPLSLLSWSLLTRVGGGRVVFLSVGGWELQSATSRFCVGRALGLAAYRSYRDQRTLAFAKSLGFRGDDRVCPDLAFAYPVGRIPRDQPPSGPRTIAISPITARAWTVEGDPQYRNYFAALRDFARALLNRGDRVCLFASQIRADTPIALRLAEALESSHGSQAVTYVEVGTVEDFFRAVRQVDLVVASRLHGVLMSCVAETPALAIAYQDKVRLLMEQMELSEYCVPLEDLNCDTLVGHLDQLYANRRQVATRMRDKVAIYREELRDQLEALFSPLRH